MLLPATDVYVCFFFHFLPRQIGLSERASPVQGDTVGAVATVLARLVGVVVDRAESDGRRPRRRRRTPQHHVRLRKSLTLIYFFFGVPSSWSASSNLAMIYGVTI